MTRARRRVMALAALAASLAASLAAVGCAPIPAAEPPPARPRERSPAPAPPAPAAAAPSAAIAALERDAHARVNAHRRARALAPLAWDDRIAAVARAHSEAMARGRVPFGHDGFGERAKAVAAVAPFASMAENVARNTHREQESARVAAESWARSAAHRRNLEGSFDRTGIGVARGAGGAWYYTQLFVRAK